MENLKVLSLFSGIGSFEKALSRLNIPFDLVNYCEIDKYADKSYSLIHNVSQELNLGDISKIDETTLPDFDLMTWGFPCQDISVAGKQKGIVQGETRSGLYYEGLRILKYKKPKYSIIENVKGLTQKKFEKEFKSILEDLNDVGYNTYWEILNSKDFGIPQNRERVFIVSIRKDVDSSNFSFPSPYSKDVKLKTILEKNVSDDLYINQLSKVEKINYTIKFNKNYVQYDLSGKGHKSQDQRAYYENGVHGTLPSNNCNTKCKVILESDAELPILHNIYGGFKEKKPRIFDDYAPTIRTAKGVGHIPSVCTNDPSKVEKEVFGYRIRKLTPLECWRLMGFDDEDFYKVKNSGMSDTQLYKQAGNSIVVNVLEAIFKNLFNTYI